MRASYAAGYRAPIAPMHRVFVWRWSTICTLFFLVLSFVCVLNLNGLLRMSFNLNRSASLVILIASIGCLVTSRVDILRALGRPGLFFGAFLIYFLLLGSLMGLDNRTFFNEFQLYIASSIVVVASATAGWRLAQQPNLSKFFYLFYIIWLLAVMSIFFSGWLRAYTMDPSVTQFRDSGFFANPNQAGSVATVAFALGFALLRGGRYSTWIVLGMAIACFGALRTFSKMSMLTIIAVAAFQLLQSTTTVRARLRVLGFALVTLGGVYWLLTTGLTLIDWQAGQLERLMEIREILLNQELNEETTTSRTLILRIGMEKFSQNPILGQGLGSFHSMPEAMGWGTHNTYLMVAGEAGIFALALLFMFLVRWAIEAMRCKDPVVRQLALNYILLFCLGCMSSHNMLNHRFHNIMFGLTFGLLSGRAYYMNRKQAEEAAEVAAQHAQRHAPESESESEPAVAAAVDAAAEPA